MIYILLSVGISRDSAATLLSLTGLLSAIGRFSAALLMTFLRSCGVDALYLYLASTVLSSTMVLLMPCSGETFNSLAVLCAVFGFAYGGICSASPVVVTELFGADRLTTVYAYTLVASGFGCLLGPPFAGMKFKVLRYTL